MIALFAALKKALYALITTSLLGPPRTVAEPDGEESCADDDFDGSEVLVAWPLHPAAIRAAVDAMALALRRSALTRAVDRRGKALLPHLAARDVLIEAILCRFIFMVSTPSTSC